MPGGGIVDEIEETLPNTPTAVVTPNSAQESLANPQLFDEYRQFECEPRSGDLLTVLWRDLVTLVRDVIAVEQPIHIDTVIDRARAVYGVSRAGKMIRARITQAVKQMAAAGVLCREESDDKFLSLAGNAGPCQPRRNADRVIGRVAPSEIDEGLLLIIGMTFGAEKADIVRETSRQFGWRRTGRDIDNKLNERVERLLEAGRLSFQANMLVLPDDLRGGAS